jgi:hypothetical protein
VLVTDVTRIIYHKRYTLLFYPLLPIFLLPLFLSISPLHPILIFYLSPFTHNFSFLPFAQSPLLPPLIQTYSPKISPQLSLPHNPLFPSTIFFLIPLFLPHPVFYSTLFPLNPLSSSSLTSPQLFPLLHPLFHSILSSLQPFLPLNYLVSLVLSSLLVNLLPFPPLHSQFTPPHPDPSSPPFFHPPPPQLPPPLLSICLFRGGRKLVLYSGLLLN